MIFPTASKIPRPVRLSESTRNWAWESLHGKYGDEAMTHEYVSLDGIENFDKLSNLEKYDIAVRKIAEEAPLRLCEQERICGSATLGGAVYHLVPATFENSPIFSSVSHLTINFERVIKKGLKSYETDIKNRLNDETLTENEKSFLKSLQNVIHSVKIFHKRYLKETENTRPDLHDLLLKVPFEPAESFAEALQSLWFIFVFTRLCGNWSGIGRIDWLLGDYLESDLKNGVIQPETARELMASFFIKGCEWIRSETPVGSGDAQHYQNIVLGGIDGKGKDITNQVTYLVLETVEELGISDFPITVRINSQTPNKLKEKTAEVIRHGGGIAAVYNESLVLEALKTLGYPENEIWKFANDGCWEVQLPGKTDFAYMPFDGLQILNRVLGVDSENIPDFSSAEEVYRAFLRELEKTVENIYRDQITDTYYCDNGIWHRKHEPLPTSVISLFEDGCIENARSYFDMGAEYTVRSPHIGGAPDVANSIFAIEKAVFQDKKLTFPQLAENLKTNWENNELLRLNIRNGYVYYGNDSDEVDSWHSRVLDDFGDIVAKFNGKDDCPVKFIAGVSTFGRQIEWLPYRSATAFGYKKGEILSGNDSPVPGTDFSGVTSVIRSHCKANLLKQPCGAALDVKLFPDSLNGDNGIPALVALIDGFVFSNGFFMQLDTMDVQTLIDAKNNPKNHKTLSVRVSGWNARFVTLDEEWQNMIIQRTAQDF